MKYNRVVQGEFISRPNRFIAYVNIDGTKETVHVKNTGRCKELLLPGSTVYLEESDNPQRKTKYDLIGVDKNGMIVNIDSQAPNRVVEEWLQDSGLFSGIVKIRPECFYEKSRFDFYVETENEKIFVEVKGVTLEENGELRFPDAPSERAVKHVEELMKAAGEGYGAYVLFVIQMEKASYFVPNEKMHPEFAAVLREASLKGVKILARKCRVTPDSLRISDPVPVFLNGKKNAGDLSEIPKPLLSWYDVNRRKLPWREEPEPYRVWVSEIMLQQTRVEAVKPYFERFMSNLPDIASLASCEEDRLLKLWEGLGYYNRVRNLQKAAIQIMEDYAGRMPDTYEELLTLKGIGSYTAGAIASIAYRRKVPAVDGNVLRVVSRIRADERLITDEKVKKSVEEDLKQIMPADRPGDFNQAMMEIGACVCIPNGAPHCSKCPLSEICLAHEQNRETDFPHKAAKKSRIIEEKTVIIVRDENKAALVKRKNKGLLAGMYEFPTLEGYRTAEEVKEYLAGNGIHTLRIQPLEDAKHIFTHKEWHMKGFMVRVDELTPKNLTKETENWIFAEVEQTQENYPVPSAYSAYAGCLHMKLGSDRFEQ